MYKVLTLNRIAPEGLRRLPRDRYEVASEMVHPDAVLVRSHDMHGMEIPSSVLAVARAGAGVNNIPVAALSQRGVPVFNAPGANANAVKELVLAGMFLAARNLCPAWDHVRGLSASGAELKKQVEAGKKTFVGFELPGRTLGVVGLGAIGVKVANAALALGLHVVGYDPAMTVKNAWRLSADVQQVVSVGDLLARSDFVSLHVPLVDATRDILNADRVRLMREGSVLLNFARGEIVDTQAVLQALSDQHLRAYVTDFPSAEVRNQPGVIALPHLGASTHEAEANCAVMVADELREFLEDGNVRNSVNFPEVEMPRTSGCRLAIANANVPNMVGRISTVVGDHAHNIVDMLNRSRGDVAYTLADIEGEVGAGLVAELKGVEGVLSVRALPAP